MTQANDNAKPKGKPPTHTIWQVVGDGDKATWIRVGAGWRHRNGPGINLRFDAHPVAGRTVLLEAKDKKDQPTD